MGDLFVQSFDGRRHVPLADYGDLALENDALRAEIARLKLPWWRRLWLRWAGDPFRDSDTFFGSLD